jgi:hypothetical protein
VIDRVAMPLRSLPVVVMLPAAMPLATPQLALAGTRSSTGSGVLWEPDPDDDEPSRGLAPRRDRLPMGAGFRWTPGEAAQ